MTVVETTPGSRRTRSARSPSNPSGRCTFTPDWLPEIGSSSPARRQGAERAGVSRGVDLEQAAARVALAESNLATEQANLYDVTSRYQRIVGDAPPAQLQPLTMLRQGTRN